MTKADVLDRIREVGVVPVLRAPSAEAALLLAGAIVAGGIPVLEVTMTVPGAIAVIRELAGRFPEALVGAGTVLDAPTAQACIAAGARFVVSPSTHPEVIALCRESDVVAVPGALTPTEIIAAWRMGADVVKVFPASAMGGAGYLRSLRGPLPQIPLLPSGGISLVNAADYLQAGALALGAGGELASVAALLAGRLEEVAATAARYRQIVAASRAQAR